MSWLTVKKWQTKIYKVYEDLLTINKTDHDNTFEGIFDIYIEKLKRMLNNPEEQKKLIDDAMNKVWNVYLE